MSNTDSGDLTTSTTQVLPGTGAVETAKGSLLPRKIFNVVNVFYIDQIKGEEFAVPPFFKEHLQNILSVEGKVVRFRCSIGGSPSPEVEWFKGHSRIWEVENDPIDECIGYKYYASNDNGNLILVISNIVQEDVGPYTCKIRNKVGEARSTAMLYSQSSKLKALKATEGRSKTTERKKIIIKETITIVEKKSLVSATANNQTQMSKVTNHENVEDRGDDNAMQVATKLHGEYEQHETEGQKVTVKFAVPKNCETKNISVETVTKSLEDIKVQPSDRRAHESDRPNDEVPLLMNTDEKGATSTSSVGFAKDSSSQATEDGVLSDTEFSEGELENREMWIRCGENSESEFRRDSIPCPLPPCFQENNGTIESAAQSRHTSQGTDASGSKEDRGLRFQLDEEGEKDASDDESKDVISRQCSILSDLSAASVFFSSSKDTSFQAFSKRYHSSERSDYLDVFEEESKRSPATSHVSALDDSKVSEVFADNGLETCSDISPLSPDFASVAQQDQEKPDQRALECTGFFKEEITHPKAEVGTSDKQGNKIIYKEIVETAESEEVENAVGGAESPREDTEMKESGIGASCEVRQHEERSERDVKRDSLIREMALLNDKFSGSDAIMGLDELIEKLLQFSQENDVFVSSLKIGYRSKKNGAIHNISVSNENITETTNTAEESSAPPLMLSTGLHFVAHEEKTTTFDEGTQSEDTIKKSVGGQKPEFVIPLQDIEVENEEDIVLNVSVTGSPAPRITWYRDDQPLDEDEGGMIMDNLIRQSAVYTCVASNEWGESRSTAKLTVKSSISANEDVEEKIEQKTEETSLQEVRMRQRKSTQSPTKRRSQIISASLVDYLRAKAITVQQARMFEKLKLLEAHRDSAIKRDSPKLCEEVTLRTKSSSTEGLAREDLTIRRGSIISLDSLTTTSYASADEELASSDTAVWDEFLSTADEDFMSTDEFASHKKSDDELFSPRPVTPTPGREPPVIYEVTQTRSLRPFTRHPTFAEFTTSSSEEMETATSGDATPVPPRDEGIFPFTNEMESQAPQFLAGMEDMKVVAGTTCTLSCTIVGYPSPQIAWYRNGIRIQASTQEGASSPRSFLSPTSSTDSKSYSVPQRFKISSECIGIDRAGEKTECTVHTLTISNSRVTDTGEYTVTAMNAYGNIVTTVQVQVKKMEDAVLDSSLQSAPLFVSALCDSDGMLGDEAVMTFQVIGIPEPEVTLMHKKAEITSDKFILTKQDNGKYTVTICDLQLEDEGEVRVRAFNNISCSECSAELFVDERTVTPTPPNYSIPQWSDHCDMEFDTNTEYRQELATQVIAPYFDEITDDVVTTPGSTASFVVRVYAWPAPEIRWYKDGQQLTEGPRISFDSTDFGSHVLKIRDVIEDDAGLYTCVVENSEGSESCKAELIISRERSSSASSSEGRRSEVSSRKLKDYYVIQKEIASGAFSMVRLALSKVDGAKNAAKYIKCASSESREKFRSETDILFSLSHDNIVGYHDCFETKKHIVIILEYIDMEWFEFLLEKDTVYEQEIASHVRQICAGLAHLHENRIAHLDMKPENIMVVKGGSVIKIVDFGSAHKIEDQEVTWDYGNPEFVSPEVVSAAPVTTASDMWSLGVIVYVVISGISPFVGESDYATVLQVQTGKWHFDNRWFTTVSDLANDFIGKLLVLNPKERIKSAEAGSHPWLQIDAKPEGGSNDVRPLPDGRLKYFLSRRKWQRSLVTPKTSLVMRPISSLLQREYDSTSVAVSRTAMSEYISSSTVTESDDEIDDVNASEGMPTSAAYRARAARMQEAAKHMRDFIHDDRKDSIFIENWIEEQQIDIEANLPEVKVIDSTPKTSPDSVRKQMSIETLTETTPESSAAGEDETKSHAEEAPEKQQTKRTRSPDESPSQQARLSPRTRMKLLDKKVSFEDELDYSPDVIQEPFVYTEECQEQQFSMDKEITDKDNQESPSSTTQISPASRPIVPVITATKASSLDRPHSVSKLLKEDKKLHKLKRGADSENLSTKDKIKKKLNLMTSRRQRSLDIVESSSSSEEDVKEVKTIKESMTPTRSKFSFFSRRKRTLKKGRSLDLPMESPEPSRPKQDSSPVLSNKSQPIKGILKRGGSSDTNSLSDPHIQRSLQNSRSPSPQAAEASRETVFGPRRYQRKPLIKGVSLDLDIVAEGSTTESLPSRVRSRPMPPAAERRRQQMTRGSSAESALPPMPPSKSRVSGLRGPLMEKGVGQDDEEPMAGMALRRSLPGGEGKVQTHTRSFSATAPLSSQSPGFDRGKFSPGTLSPRVPGSAPPRRISPLSRGAFFSQSIDIGGSHHPNDILPTENTLNDRKTLSLQLPTSSRPMPRSRSHERPLARRQRSSERRQGECYAPSLKAHLLDQGVTQSQTCVNFICMIDAMPLPEVVWYKGDEELNSSDKYEVISEPSLSKYQLKIRTVNLPEDFGQYSCEARNTVGAVNTFCNLKPAVTPGKPSAPEFSGNDGSNLWITWNPPSNCAPSPIAYMLQYREMAAMKWVLVDDAIKDTLYKIENLRPTTSYRFRVRASNNAGVGPFSKVSHRITLDPRKRTEPLQYTF